MNHQLLIQRVTNGIIVSPVNTGGSGVELSQIAVFTALDHTLLTHLSSMLDRPISMAEVAHEDRKPMPSEDGADE